jgi:hypothetical protein
MMDIELFTVVSAEVAEQKKQETRCDEISFAMNSTGTGPRLELRIRCKGKSLTYYFTLDATRQLLNLPEDQMRPFLETI